MDKLKKSLIIPAIYHAAVFIAMIYFRFTKDIELNIVFALVLDFAGVVVGPMFYAVVSIAHAILHDGKVYDYLYHCLGYIGGIGVVRIILYPLLMGTSLIIVGAAASFVSLGVFVIWDCLFALTDRMMKKRPGRKRQK